jgi:GcrA cell cycle regulator
MSWTDERIATLKKMWKEGKSAAEIAKTLAKGVTRNAVIGKAHRMGLSGRPSPIKKPAAPPKKDPPKKEVKAVVKKPVVPVVTGVKHNPLIREVTAPRQFVKEVFPIDGGVGLIDLTERMCKWPFGDPREDDFTFCGRPIRPGTPYCPDHAAMAYQSSGRSRSAPVPEEKVVEESADDDEAVVVT